MATVLISGSDLLEREGVRAVLNAQGGAVRVLGCCPPEQLADRSAALRPDVLLICARGHRGPDPADPRVPSVLLCGTEEERPGPAGAAHRAVVARDCPPALLAGVLTAVAAGYRLLPALPARPGSAATLPGLTARELDILRCLHRGLSNREIATRLSLGTGTVKSHVSTVLTKLGVANRTLAALYYDTAVRAA